jgi:hypothetical protein
MAAVAAIVTISFSGQSRVQDAVGLTGAGLVWTGIWQAVLAVLLLLVAGGIMRGSRGFRLLVAVVMGIRIVSAVALMLIHHTGAYLFNGLIDVALAVFVLWALYGYSLAFTEGNAYFGGLDRLFLKGAPHLRALALDPRTGGRKPRLRGFRYGVQGSVGPVRRQLERHQRAAEIEMKGRFPLGVSRRGQSKHETSKEMIDLTVADPAGILALQCGPGRFGLWSKALDLRRLLPRSEIIHGKPEHWS